MGAQANIQVSCSHTTTVVFFQGVADMYPKSTHSYIGNVAVLTISKHGRL